MSETWRDRLVAAHAGVADAEKRRREIFLAALEAGLSTRAISEVVGVPHSTVWRWAGKRGRAQSAEILDSPVGTPA